MLTDECVPIGDTKSVEIDQVGQDEIEYALIFEEGGNMHFTLVGTEIKELKKFLDNIWEELEPKLK